MIAAAHAACADTIPTDLELWENELAAKLSAAWVRQAAKCGTFSGVPALDGGDCVMVEWPSDADTCPKKIDVHVEVEQGRMYRDCVVSLQLVAIHPVHPDRRHMVAEFRNA